MIAPRIKRPEARVLAEEEFRRFAELAASLSDEEWATPTECTGWDVRKMALHVLGSADAQARSASSFTSSAGACPLNKEIDSHHWVDGLNELQIRERVAPLQRRARRRSSPPSGRRRSGAAGGRRRPMRYLPLPFGPRSGGRRSSTCSTSASPATCGPTASTSASRSAAPMHVTADHDGRLVADIVAEWAAIHGQPFELVLDGPAGGKFSQGADGEHVEIDALDFIRTLSGRLPGTGVLSNPLPL